MHRVTSFVNIVQYLELFKNFHKYVILFMKDRTNPSTIGSLVFISVMHRKAITNQLKSDSKCTTNPYEC